MSSKHTELAKNRLLASLSPGDRDLLDNHLEQVDVRFRQRLQSQNRVISHVYFLLSGLGSVVAIGGGERRQCEVAIVGNEGMTGLAIIHGVDRDPCETFMQVEGLALRIEADALRALLVQSATLHGTFLRYAHVFSIQTKFTALANARGSLQERLARWLLMAQDRLDDDDLVLTHEFLALMLGVRRAGVTTAMTYFEQRGILSKSRGAVTVLDREGLQEYANGLYGVPEAEYERLFRRNADAV